MSESEPESEPQQQQQQQQQQQGQQKKAMDANGCASPLCQSRIC